MKNFITISIMCLVINFDSYAQSSFRKIIDVFYASTPLQERVLPMTLTHDSAVVFCQRIQDSLTVGLGVFKINYSGNLVWAKFYNHPYNELYNDIIELPDGSFVLAGNKNLWAEYFVLKLDSLGNLLFHKTIGDSNLVNLSNCFSVCMTSDGNLAFTGKMQNSGFLVKTDYNGNVIWSKRYYHNPTQADTYGWKVISTNDGGLLTIGYTAEPDTINPGINFNMHALKTDINGNAEWFREVSDSITSYVFGDVIQTSTGDYLIAAYATYPVYKPSLLKLSSTGEIKWYKGYSEGHAPFTGIEELPNGNYIFCSQKKYEEGPMLTVTDTAGTPVPYFNIQFTMYNSVNYEYTGIPSFDQYSNYFLLNEKQEAVIYSSVELNGVYKPILIKTDSLFNTDCYTHGLDNADTSFIPISIDTTVTMINLNAQAHDFTNMVTYYDLNPVVGDFCLFLSTNEISHNDVTVEVVPNPFTSIVSININNLNEKINSSKLIHVTIRNIYGQSVVIIDDENVGASYSKNIELSTVAQGLYFIDIIFDKGRIVRKIIKQ